MADKFQLSVLTPSHQVFDGSVETVEISGALGAFGVLPGHYAYITSVRPGGLEFQIGGKRHVYAVGHGFAQVAADRVSIVVSSCEDAATLDLGAAREALARAEAVLAETEDTEPRAIDAKIEQEAAMGKLLAADWLGTH
jgi:F-type H+-transporting ATPase subunit epsilon